jgi:hypothetical protein
MKKRVMKEYLQIKHENPFFGYNWTGLEYACFTIYVPYNFIK